MGLLETFGEVFSPIPLKRQKAKSVYKIVKDVYDMMNNEFDSITLIRIVRYKSLRPDLYDGTILRELRQLREDGKINFTVIDRRKSKYKKL